MELIHDLVVLNLDVLALQVPVDQLLDRAGQVFVGHDHGKQLTDVELAGDREIAADRVENERRQLGHEIVQRLDEVFALIKFEADVEDTPEAAHDVGAFPVRGAVDANVGPAVDDFTDAPGKFARLKLAHLAELQDRLAQARDDDRLAEDHRRRNEAKPEVLNQNENQRGQRLTREKDRPDHRVARKAAQGFDLVLHHRGDFGLLGLAQMRRREAQHAVDEVVAQAAQQAFAEAALHRVDQELQEAVEADEC